jgi:flagellar basal body rod protein FlgG
MITAQRAYEANSKVIKTADEMLAIANNIKR